MDQYEGDYGGGYAAAYGGGQSQDTQNLGVMPQADPGMSPGIQNPYDLIEPAHQMSMALVGGVSNAEKEQAAQAASQVGMGLGGGIDAVTALGSRATDPMQFTPRLDERGNPLPLPSEVARNRDIQRGVDPRWAGQAPAATDAHAAEVAKQGIKAERNIADQFPVPARQVQPDQPIQGGGQNGQVAQAPQMMGGGGMGGGGFAPAVAGAAIGGVPMPQAAQAQPLQPREPFLGDRPQTWYPGKEADMIRGLASGQGFTEPGFKEWANRNSDFVGQVMQQRQAENTHVGGRPEPDQAPGGQWFGANGNQGGIFGGGAPVFNPPPMPRVWRREGAADVGYPVATPEYRAHYDAALRQHNFDLAVYGLGQQVARGDMHPKFAADMTQQIHDGKTPTAAFAGVVGQGNFEPKFTPQQMQKQQILKDAREKAQADPTLNENQRKGAVDRINEQLESIRPAWVPKPPPINPPGQEVGAVWTDPQTGNQMTRKPSAHDPRGEVQILQHAHDQTSKLVEMAAKIKATKEGMTDDEAITRAVTLMGKAREAMQPHNPEQEQQFIQQMQEQAKFLAPKNGQSAQKPTLAPMSKEEANGQSNGPVNRLPVKISPRKELDGLIDKYPDPSKAPPEVIQRFRELNDLRKRQ